MINDKDNFFSINSNLQNSFSSHNQLCKLAYEIENTNAPKITIDLTNVNFIASNLFSVLGCICSDYARKNPCVNPILITGMKQQTINIIKKNGFCEHLGLTKIPDVHNTVIPYKRFSVNEIDEYERYLTINLFTRKDLPQMSKGVSNLIRDYLLELFKNVMDHTI